MLFEHLSLAGGRHGGGRGHDALAGTTVKIRQGPYKGYRGRVVEVKGQSVRVELESQMKVVTGKFWTMGEHTFQRISRAYFLKVIDCLFYVQWTAV